MSRYVPLRKGTPCVMQRTKARALAGDGRQRVQQVAGGSRQPVKARHRQHVALVELRESAGKLGAVGPRAAGRLSKDLLGFGRAKLLHLRVEALAVGRYPRIAVNHDLLCSSFRVSRRRPWTMRIILTAVSYTHL